MIPPIYGVLLFIHAAYFVSGGEYRIYIKMPMPDTQIVKPTAPAPPSYLVPPESPQRQDGSIQVAQNTKLLPPTPSEKPAPVHTIISKPKYAHCLCKGNTMSDAWNRRVLNIKGDNFDLQYEKDLIGRWRLTVEDLHNAINNQNQAGIQQISIWLEFEYEEDLKVSWYYIKEISSSLSATFDKSMQINVNWKELSMEINHPSSEFPSYAPCGLSSTAKLHCTLTFFNGSQAHKIQAIHRNPINKVYWEQYVDSEIIVIKFPDNLDISGRFLKSIQCDPRSWVFYKPRAAGSNQFWKLTALNVFPRGDKSIAFEFIIPTVIVKFEEINKTPTYLEGVLDPWNGRITLKIVDNVWKGEHRKTVGWVDKFLSDTGIYTGLDMSFAYGTISPRDVYSAGRDIPVASWNPVWPGDKAISKNYESIPGGLVTTVFTDYVISYTRVNRS